MAPNSERCVPTTTSKESKQPCVCCKKKMKYIPPPVTKSFKPPDVYRSAGQPLAADTVQKLSFQGFDSETAKLCKSKSYKPSTVYQPSSYQISDDTTFKNSYTGQYVKPIGIIKPTQRNLSGSGPFESMTTCKHDYTPKPFVRVQNFKPSQKYVESGSMENMTTMSASYQPNENIPRLKSFKPDENYRSPMDKLEADTVQKLSYQPCQPLDKEYYPWAERPKYVQPMHRMEGSTVYRNSYFCGDCDGRRQPFKPIQSAMQDNSKLSSDTVYQLSYQLACSQPSCRPESFKPKNIFVKSDFPFAGETTFNCSFTGVPGVKTKSMKPAERDMMGTGAFESMTTAKHDYTPKIYEPVTNYKPAERIVKSGEMEGMSTMAASYPHVTAPRVESFKPSNLYKKSSGIFEKDTIQNLSYQPWTAQPKEDIPWARRPAYTQPTHRLAGDTVYRGSFMLPGTTVPDTSDCEDTTCNCTPTMECHRATEGIA